MANESVMEMIKQLHARLKDMEKIVASSPIELAGYDKKLDRVDDSVYLLQVEMEKLITAASGSAESAEPEQPASDADADEVQGESAEEEKESTMDKETKIGPVTITPDMKAGMKDGAQAAAEVLRDSKDVLSEISGAMGDIKEVFSFGGSTPRRRR